MIFVFSNNASADILRSIAERVKAFLLSEYGSKTLQSFCYECSEELANELKRNGFKPIMVKGQFMIDNPFSEYYSDWNSDDFGSLEEMEEAQLAPLHYWLEVDGLIVDISADQFNDEIDEPMPSVIVGSYEEFPRYKKQSWMKM